MASAALPYSRSWRTQTNKLELPAKVVFMRLRR